MVLKEQQTGKTKTLTSDFSEQAGCYNNLIIKFSIISLTLNVLEVFVFPQTTDTIDVHLTTQSCFQIFIFSFKLNWHEN